MKNYELFSGNELQIADMILRRRLQLLVHSCIYYEFGTSLVDDRVWDNWARELVQLQKEYPNIAENVDLFGSFADWDGSTGFKLPLKDSWVMSKSKYLLSIWNKSTADNDTVISKKSGKKKLF